MFRRLFAVITSLVLALTLVQPASADGDAWVTIKPQSEVLSNNYRIRTFELPNHSKVFFYTDRVANEYYQRLISQTVSATGEVSQPVVVSQSSGDSFSFLENFDVVLTRTGTLALAWAWSNNDWQNHSATSDLYVAFSDDGVIWSNPISPLPTSHSTEMCDPFMDACGYENVHLAVDGTGRVALVVAEVLSYQSARLLALSTGDGLVWTAPTVIDTFDRALDFGMTRDVISLQALDSGFTVLYSKRKDSSMDLKAVRMPSGNLPFWQPPVVLENNSFVDKPTINVSKTGDILASWWSYPSSGSPSLKTSRFETATKKWSDPSTLYASSAQWIQYQSSTTNGYITGFAWAEITNGVPDTVKAVVLTNAVAGSIQTVVAPQGAITGDYVLTGMGINLDNSLSVSVYRWSTHEAKIFDVTNNSVSTTYNLPIQTGMYPWDNEVTFNAVGDITYVQLWADNANPQWQVLSLTRSSKPVATGLNKVKGSSLVGKKLTGTSATFKSISGAGAPSYQWYSCTKQVKTPPVSLPKTCKAIKGATKSTYTPIKTDAKKFIVLATSSTNSLGKTTVYSASTKAVK